MAYADVAACDRIFRGLAFDNVEAGACEIGCRFFGCSRINVIQAHRVDTDHFLEGERLKFALRPIAYHRHCF